MTVQEAYNYSVYFLGANGVDEEEFKAKCLVCHLAKIANRDYHSHLGDLVSQKKLADGLWQLKSGTPLQYVLGEWDFLDSTFAVGPGVLIPRPETEELAQLAIEQVKNAGSTPVVWDLCAGSGCIFGEAQQPVAVVLVLLAACLDFGGQSRGEVVHQCVEFVEDGDDAFLFFERRNGNWNPVQICLIQFWLRCATDV